MNSSEPLAGYMQNLTPLDCSNAGNQIMEARICDPEQLGCTIAPSYKRMFALQTVGLAGPPGLPGGSSQGQGR